MAINRLLRILCGLLPLSLGCTTAQGKAQDAQGNENKGGSVEDPWKAAEAVARGYITSKDGKSPSKVRRDLARYSFAVRRADGTWVNVLVHNRAVVEPSGVAGLGTYLKDEGFLTSKSVELPQLLSLLELYRAFPPLTSPATYLTGGPLAPQLSWAADGSAALVLHYSRAGNGAVDNTPILKPASGPSVPGASIRATLAIPGSYALSWTLSDGPAY